MRNKPAKPLGVRDGGHVLEKSENRMPKSERRSKPESRRRSRALFIRPPDFEFRISRATGRALVAGRLARACRAIAERRRINIAFDNEVGGGGNPDFNSGKMFIGFLHGECY